MRMKGLWLAGMAGLALIGSGCGHKEVKPENPDIVNIVVQEQQDAQKTREEQERQEIMDMIDGMTPEEKAAQLFVVTPETITGVSQVVAAGETTKEAINTYPVAGFVYLSQNLQDETQVKEMLSGVQSFSEERIGLPMFLCLDEEGGTVARVAGNEAFNVTDIGNMSDLGATGDTEAALDAGSTVGAYLKALGFNVDFAPVADVLADPDYELLKDRAFGSDPALVADMTLAFSKGLLSEGVQSVYKHFPGHGAASGDSHEGYVEVTKTMDALEAEDLLPFKKGIGGSSPWIMVGHIATPKATGNDLPATMSKEIITDLLRNKMGFDGIVITDALEMDAIAANYSSAEAAVAALQAGVDLLLMPADFYEAYQGVLDAMASGTLSEDRVNESLFRIIRARKALQEDN